MPFKLNQDRRHHVPRQKHRVTNSVAHDTALRQRGSLTVWFTDEATEVDVAVHALNRMVELGRPNYVRTA